VPDVRHEAWADEGPDYVYAYIGPPGLAGGVGVQLNRAEPAAEQVARLADQVQEWEVEELCARGRPATWPRCPEHPDSHPLTPEVAPDGTAVWRCPRSARVAGVIGRLEG
jgi:hypothetical protein